MIKGIGVSDGIGTGKIILVKEPVLDYSAVIFSGKENESKRLHDALEKFTEETTLMVEKIKAEVGQKESEILQGHIEMIKDPFMSSQLEEQIEGGNCAEAAIDIVCQMYIGIFSSVEDELMRQRATDVGDIKKRMLCILLNQKVVDLSALPPESIVVAKDFTPSMTVAIKRENVSAMVAEIGGKTSHSAILARALEIPAVLGVNDIMSQLKDGDTAIVDGAKGDIIVNPEESIIAQYKKQQQEEQKKKEELLKYKSSPTVDADGNKYDLYANIGSVAETQIAIENGAEGIGLFRTEFLYMERDCLPGENEQFEVYSKVSEIMQGKEVIIRTLDIGGDKDIPYMGLEKEDNPFLGHRAIRFCLDRTDLFEIQLKALLRAGSKYKNIKILIPMVTCVDELRSAKALLEKCKSDLKAQNIEFDNDIKVGIMIETPASSLISDILAKEADFFSIGTNDLTQYTMAVDRGNAKVEKLYSTFNPAVLRSIRNVISSAKKENIPVGMCGEAAADTALIPLLMSFGLDEFSVSVSAILKTRKAISEITLEKADKLTTKAMELLTEKDVSAFLCNQ